MKRLFFIVVAFFLFYNNSGNAQTKEETDYRNTSEEIRKQVFGWKMPEFNVHDIPQQYAKSSKVVIARHTELTADSKTKFKFLIITAGLQKEANLSEVVREMVKLNDKSAIDEYSEISYTQIINKSGFLLNDKTTTFIGIRVIKPTGTIKYINADDAVLTKNDVKDKKAKIAIPDLEPGDILDYFIATQRQVTNDFDTHLYQEILYSDAPILSLSFHAQLGKKYTVEYRSYNGAPDVKVTRGDDDDIIIDLEKKDIPPTEASYWVASEKQIPFIRMNISLGFSGIASKYLGIKKPGVVTKNRNSDDVISDIASKYSSKYYSGYWMRQNKAEYDQILSDARKKAKQMNIVFDNLNDIDKAKLLYYTLRFNKILNFDINELSKKVNIGDLEWDGLAFVSFCTLKAANLNPAILITTNRTGVAMNEIMDESDTKAFAYLPSAKKFYSIQTVYDIPAVAPASIEGANTYSRSFTFDHPAMIMSLKKSESLTNVSIGTSVPVSTSDKNAHIENLKLTLSADKSKLQADRSTILKGYLKSDVQKNLILYEDFYEEERKAFNEPKSLIEQLEDNKKSRKNIDEVKNVFAEARNKQKDAFLTDAKEWYEQEITDLSNYSIQSLGVRDNAPDFVYSSSFKLGGLIKKAGNNLIIEIGKIQGSPFNIKPEQRKRDLDIYMPFARSFEYNIELDIPDGYTAEGINALNKKIENETGKFVVEATANSKTVSIKFQKHYFHNYEPAKNWDELLAIIDAANDWLNAKILFKKK